LCRHGCGPHRRQRESYRQCRPADCGDVALSHFAIEKTRLLDRLRGELNARQEKALLRMLRDGPEGFKGGLSAGNYAAITGASPATATRDLADLVDKSALLRVTSSAMRAIAS